MEQNVLEQFPTFIQKQWEKEGFSSLTPVQERALPPLLDGKDLIIESPTGTGKTLGYLLPIFNKIDYELKKTQALIIAPTRELVMQINQVAQTWLTTSESSSAAFIGGADIKRQVEKLKKHPTIVVGTPDRLQELVSMKKLKMHEVRTIVLDEADQLFSPDTKPKIEDLIRTTLAERQVIVVSATITERTEAIAKTLMKQPDILRIPRGNSEDSNVEHVYIVSHPREKIDALRDYIKAHNVKGLVFINGSAYIPEVAKRLKSRGVQSGILSGEGTKTEREATVIQFRKGQFPILLTTDLAARGLDIEGITHVFHFDLPEAFTQYIHRSGRTGRQGAEGTVVSILTPRDEKNLQQFAGQLQVTLKKLEGYPKAALKHRTPHRSTTNRPVGEKGKSYGTSNHKNSGQRTSNASGPKRENRGNKERNR